MTFRLTPPKVKLSENDVERQCLDLARYRGWFVIRIHCGTFRSWDGKRVIRGAHRGTPDYAMIHRIHPGFLFECKRPGAEPSPDQDRRMVEIAIGYELAICVADSVEEFRDWLNLHEQQLAINDFADRPRLVEPAAPNQQPP